MRVSYREQPSQVGWTIIIRRMHGNVRNAWLTENSLLPNLQLAYRVHQSNETSCIVPVETHCWHHSCLMRLTIRSRQRYLPINAYRMTVNNIWCNVLWLEQLLVLVDSTNVLYLLQTRRRLSKVNLRDIRSTFLLAISNNFWRTAPLDSRTFRALSTINDLKLSNCIS